MPIYEYQCRECDRRKEVLVLPKVDGNSTAASNVPICCDYPMRRTPSSRTSFQLNGDGWAKDGYQKPEKGKE